MKFRKQLSCLLLGVMTLSVFSPISASAAGNLNIEPRITFKEIESVHSYEETGGVNYDLYTSLYCAPADNKYKGGVWIEADKTVPAEYMWAEAHLYEASGGLLAKTSMLKNEDSTNFHWVITGSIGSTEDSIWADGKFKLYSGHGTTYLSGDTEPVHFKKSNALVATTMESISEYPTTKDGKTYGSLLNADTVGYEPDFVRAVGTDGTRGYVKLEDVSPELYTLDAARERMATLHRDNKIPLYDLNENVIGEFEISVYDSESETDPAVLEKVQQLSMNKPEMLSMTKSSPVKFRLSEKRADELKSFLDDGQYPVNKNGETYGPADAKYIVGYEPDLICATGENGITGYSYTWDINRSSYTGAPLNVYDLNGNVIDHLIPRMGTLTEDEIAEHFNRAN